jgi:hypothetical protein
LPHRHGHTHNRSIQALPDRRLVALQLKWGARGPAPTSVQTLKTLRLEGALTLMPTSEEEPTWTTAQIGATNVLTAAKTDSTGATRG